jgi:multicomponent Na+:H+ antiporter subunit C
MTILTIAVAGALCACGTYLLLGRQLSRIVIGIGLLGHGVNILLVTSGGDAGTPVFIGDDPSGFADPLPQALVLTAIVITFGVIAFLLSMAYRSWQVTGNDEVEDDFEDRLVAARAAKPVEPEDLPAEQLADPDPDAGR